MNRRMLCVAALCAMLCVNVTIGAEEKADASTPKGAVSAFFKAMERGDAAGAKALSNGTAKQLEVLDIIVPVASGLKALENAAVKKWGEDAKKVLTDGPGGGFDFEKNLAEAKVTENGDTATIVSGKADEQEKQPLTLKKSEGKWKVDLGFVPVEQFSDPMLAKIFKGLGEAAKETAGEIDAGKYKTAQEAKQAMMMKVAKMAPVGPGAGEAPTPPQK